MQIVAHFAAEPGVLPGVWAVDPAVLYATDGAGALAFWNDPYESAATEGDASRLVANWPLGRPLLECVPPDLRRFYEGAVRAAAPGHPFEHDYECSTPELRRFFRLTLYALPAGAGHLWAHTLSRTAAVPAAGEEAPHSAYQGKGGIITQCANCRRVRRVDTAAWDWVPSLLTVVPGARLLISHGLCALCFEHHYPATD